MNSIMPENYSSEDFVVISLVGLSEEELEYEYGGATHVLNTLTDFINGLLKDSKDINLELFDDEDMIDSFPNCTYANIENTYFGGSDFVVDQSLMGGTEVLVTFNKPDGQVIVPILIGSSTITSDKEKKTLIITRELVNEDKKIRIFVIKY